MTFYVNITPMNEGRKPLINFNRTQRTLTVLAVALTTAGLATGLVYDAISKHESPLLSGVMSEADGRLLRREVQQQASQLASLQARLDSLLSARGGLPNGDAQAVASSLKAVETRVNDLETALGETPSKSLATVILRHDFDGYREQHQRDITSLAADIGRIYDINKWLIGFFGGAILAMAAKAFFEKRGGE
jgi:hypothetical protein